MVTRYTTAVQTPEQIASAEAGARAAGYASVDDFAKKLGIPAITPPPATPSPAPTTSLGKEFNDTLIRYTQESSPEAQAKREAEIRAESDRQRQATIDAINQVYAPRITRVQKQGEDRLALNRAATLYGGTGGSPISEAKKDKTIVENDENLKAIESEKLLAIQTAIEKADDAAVKKIQIANDTRIKNQAERDKAYQTILEQALASLKTFGAYGLNLDQLKAQDPKLYENIRNVTGKSDTELDLFLRSNKPKQEILKVEKVGNKIVYFTQNPDGSIKSNEYAANINPQEEFKIVDGEGYGVKKDASGNLVLRKLTDKPVKPVTYKFDNPARGKLIGSGLSEPEINQLESDIRKYGAQLVIDGITDENQKKVIQAILSGEKSSDKNSDTKNDRILPSSY